MVIVMVLFMALLVLDLAALCWGFDSTDPIDSPEWERRQQWEAWHYLARRQEITVRRKNSTMLPATQKMFDEEMISRC